jgi:hypothetical protein
MMAPFYLVPNPRNRHLEPYPEARFAVVGALEEADDGKS